MENETHRRTRSLAARLGLAKGTVVLTLGLLIACGSTTADSRTVADTSAPADEALSPQSASGAPREESSTPTLDALNELTRGVASLQGLPQHPIPTSSAESCARAQNAAFDAMPSGICRTEQYAWTGSSCMPIDEPSCLGSEAAPNPEDIYADRESCEAAHAHCGL